MIIEPGKVIYFGNYCFNQDDEFYLSKDVPTTHLSKHYGDDVFTTWFRRQYNLTEADVNQVINFYGDDTYFEIEGIFEDTKDLAYHWIHRCAEIDDDSILECIDYEKYGKLMIENQKEYEDIIITDTGKYILAYGKK